MANETYTIEISEDEMWAVVAALHEYGENPISEIHGKLSKNVYERIKAVVLKRSSERLIEANGRRAAGLE